MDFNTYDEIEQIKTLSNIEIVQYLQNGLIGRATGSDFDNEIYQFIRSLVMKNENLKDYLPSWVKTCRSTDQFWHFIKNKFQTYAERREFIWSEFSIILDILENGSVSPIEQKIIFDEDNIHSQWNKALERKTTDPEGAITIARTLIESVFKHILDKQGISYNDSSELSELYKEVAKSLNMAPEQHQEQIFKQILGGANGIVSGLGSLRNKLGDAHGKGHNFVKPKERHSELAVNLAGSIAIFIYKTYKEQKTL